MLLNCASTTAPELGSQLPPANKHFFPWDRDCWRKHLRKGTNLFRQGELLPLLTRDTVQYRVESPQSLSPQEKEDGRTGKKEANLIYFTLFTHTPLCVGTSTFSSLSMSLTSSRRAQQMLPSVTRCPSSGRNKFTSCFFPMKWACKVTTSNELISG